MQNDTISGFKTFPFRECKAEGDDGLFSGYASTYNKDLQGDKIAPGAFGKTIADNKGLVPILYNHNVDQPPVGFSTALAEDGKGLMLAGKLATNTSGGNDAYQMLKVAAAVGFRMGLSIGFTSDDWEWDDATNLRTINQIDLWEVSLTPFPAQTRAYVNDVKSFRDFEKYLRDVEHFSRPDAKRIMHALSSVTDWPLCGMPDATNESRLLRLLAQMGEPTNA